jgi:hypothetical protein
MRLVYLQQLMQLPNLVHLDQSFIRDINNKYGLGGGGCKGYSNLNSLNNYLKEHRREKKNQERR